MSSIKLTADSGGGSVSLKAPATTTSNAALEITVPDVATGSSVVTADSSGHISLADSKEIKLGTGADLKLYNNGSHSYALNTTCQFILGGDTVLIKDAGNSEVGLKYIKDGAVELYHNDSKKLETTADGVSATGQVVATTNFKGVDDVSLVLGTGSDFRILHDGTDNVLTSDGGQSIRLVNHLAGGNESMAVFAPNDYVQLYHNGVVKVTTASNGVLIGGHCRPWTSRDDTDDLGGASQRWDDIHATNSTIQTSDRNEKESITATDLGLTFVNKLTPVSFKRKGKTRTHYGLVAQDVETVITDLGKTTTQFAGFIKSDISEEQDGSSYRYGLRMGEFTAPLIKAIQELSAEVETLKTKVAALEAA